MCPTVVAGIFGNMKRSRGQIEAEIRAAILNIWTDFMGRGPTDVRAFILRDMVVVRLGDDLTPAEHRLAEGPEGAAIVKRMREDLIAQARGMLEEIISRITGTTVLGLFMDVNTASGDRVLVFTLGADLEKAFHKPHRPGRAMVSAGRKGHEGVRRKAG